MAFHNDGTMNDHDFAIAEMKYYREAKRKQDLYEEGVLTIVKHIEGIVTEDQIKSWMLIETIIDGESRKRNPMVDPDHIRAKLVEDDED